MNAPESVYSKGKYNFGQFTSPFKHVNLYDAKESAPLPFINTFFLREWQAFQVFTEGYFGIMALYNTKKVSLVQFIFYNIASGEKYKFEKKVLPWNLNVPNGLFRTKGEYRSSDCTVVVEHDIENSLLDIRMDLPKTKKHPALKARLKGTHNIKKYTPIVVCMPFNEKRGMYSHKCLMPLEGEINLGGKIIHFDPKNSNLIIDDHKGYYPYVTKYDWITGAGFTPEGKRIGFNFTDNQIQNKEKYNENGVWVDGELTYLPPIQVLRPNGYKKDWIVKDKSDQVRITFTPVEHNAVNLNLLILKSKYQGPYGYFNGFIQTKNQGRLEFNNIFGMGEDFYLRS